jgi:tetratricopeptide (TPR) repeat protein
MIRLARFRSSTSVLAAAVALAAVQTAKAQPQMNPMPQPEKVSNRALQLAAEGQLAEAEKALQQALAQCQRSGAPPNCAALLNFTRAYLAQQRGRQGADEARAFYRNVLATQPSNAAALNNLALIEDSLGNNAEAESLWKQAIQNDPGRTGHYALLLGDHYLRLKNIAAAVDSYDQAGQATPEAAVPRRHILEAFRQTAGTDGLEALESRAEQWERIDAGIARAAYEFLMSRWSSNSHPRADRCLVRWAGILARNDWLDSRSLAALPASWDHPGVRELRLYVSDPLDSSQWNWWRRDADRLAVMFEIARTTGRRQLRESENGPAKAERCWQSALRTVSPELLAMEFPAAVNGYLRVSQELASLYFESPSMDPQQARMAEIVRQLYEGKMVAIRRGDRRVTQAFHTTLALIYVARGTWESVPGTPSYMSAWYQLQAVLDDAGRREKDEHFYQPLPEIKSALAMTLTHIPDKKNQAGPMYFQAALAFLDADAPMEASKTLAAHRELGPLDAGAKQFEQILSARISPAGLSLTTINNAKAPWLYQASGTLDDGFLKRQRFKIYADLAGSSSAGPTQLEAALEAYGLAAEQQTNLMGGGDLLRWQRVEATLLATGNLQAPPARILTANGPGPTEAGLRITLAGEDQPAAVAVRRETPVAAQVIRTIGITKMPDLQPYLRLRAEGLEIAPVPEHSELAPLLDKIKNTSNIRLIRRSAVAPH